MRHQQHWDQRSSPLCDPCKLHSLFFFLIFFIWENEGESLIWTTFKEREHECPWASHTANHTTTAYTQGFKWLMVSLLSKMTVIQELVTKKTPVSLSLVLTDVSGPVHKDN